MSAIKRKGPLVNSGICRCCGSTKKCRLLNADYEFEGTKEVYSDMIMDCFGLIVSIFYVLDVGPAMACRVCCGLDFHHNHNLRHLSSFFLHSL